MMTLQEAIAHCKEKAKELREQAGFDTDNERYRMSESEKADCIECANEHEQLASWLTELQERREADRWIPVSERLPDDREDTYWVCTESGYQCQCRWTNVNPFWTNLKTDWHWCHFDTPQYQNVTAWKPLPEPYESEA